ncbi:hypothetical protein [Alistipes putredinis]|uniref:hypothetical protein n=1 Tax=Alistipes putredinis TaxID=28117 RepID=UPI003992BBB5
MGDVFGRWSEPARFPFVVLTPWYATGWAYAGYVLLLAFTFYCLWLLVMRFYRRRYLRRLRLAGDRRVAARQPGADPADRDARRAEIVAQSSTLIGRNEIILRLRDMVNEFQQKQGSRTTAPLWQKVNAYVSSKLDAGERLDAVPDQVRAEALFLFPHHEGTLPRPDDQRSASERLPENESLYQGDRLADESVGAGGRERPLPAAKKKLESASAQNLNEFLLHIDSQESGPEDDEK